MASGRALTLPEKPPDMLRAIRRPHGSLAGVPGSMKRFALFALAAVSALFLAAAPASAGTLDQAQKRGKLLCGVHPGLPGFGLQDNAQWVGFDVDFCRAVAAAVFNDPTRIEFIPLTAKDRFTALQSGEVDLLSRNTTWSLSREAGQGFLFAGVTYFDGQAFMVRKKLNVTSALELSGASICVIQGTTTELNLSDYFRANNMKFEPVTYAYADEAVARPIRTGAATRSRPICPASTPSAPNSSRPRSIRCCRR
jgi:ABC-type amino acid transport substrate-binding protein